MKKIQEDVRMLRRGGIRRRHVTAVFVILVLAVGAAGFCLTEEKAQKIQRTGSIAAVRLKVPGRESMVLNPLRQEEETSKISAAIKNYYAELKEKEDFAETYEDIQVYVKDGMYKDTYVAFVRYGMKIRDIYTKVPGLETLYIEKERDSGDCRILTEDLDEDTKDYIQTVAEHEDVRNLLAQMEEEYQKALRSDALLREALTDLQNALEDSTENE